MQQYAYRKIATQHIDCTDAVCEKNILNDPFSRKYINNRHNKEIDIQQKMYLSFL